MACLRSSSSSFSLSFSSERQILLCVKIKEYQLHVGTCVADEVKPLLSHLNPDYTLSPQLRVDGGELSSKCVIVEHLVDKIAQLFRIRDISIL